MFIYFFDSLTYHLWMAIAYNMGIILRKFYPCTTAQAKKGIRDSQAGHAVTIIPCKKLQGPVVQSWFSVNPGLKLNPPFSFVFSMHPFLLNLRKENFDRSRQHLRKKYFQVLQR